MSTAPDPTGKPAPPDPPKDRDGAAMPSHIAHAIWIVETLLVYGTHLARTLDSRAAARGFAVIAHCFGTASVPPILARVRRGILRAIALLRVLRARGARGRDLTLLRQRDPAPRPPAPADQPAAVSRQAASERPRDGTAWNDTPLELAHLPTIAAFEARIRRQTVGRAIVDVCLDLGLRPLLCTKAFWNQIFDTQLWYRGNLPLLLNEMDRRATAYRKEADRIPALSLPDTSFAGIRRGLGFLIGEDPVNPHAAPALGFVPALMAPAAATGPP